MDVEPMCSWTCFVKDTYACWGPAGPTNAEHQQEIVQ